MSTRDLSEVHGHVGSLFSQASLGCARSQLNATQVATFHEQGYLAGIPVLNELQRHALLDDLTEIQRAGHTGHEFWYEYHSNESADPNRTLFHALGAWRVRASFHDVLWHEAILAPAAQLLGAAVRFWHDQLFCKPAHHGGVVAWHQDYSYWTRTSPMQHLTCWIALDDSTRQNGCVHYIPGSHRWPLLPITGLAGDMNSIRSQLDDAQWAQFQQPHAPELRAGECVFHHPLMVHGSFENSSPRPRRAVVLNFVADGVGSTTDAPLLQGVDSIPNGTPLTGRFFPLLYPPPHEAGT